MAFFVKLANKITSELKGIPLHRKPVILCSKAIFKIKTGLRLFPLKRRLLHVYKNQDVPISVLFFTTHKCASIFTKRLFDILLKKSNYLFVDYESAIEGLGDKIVLGTPSNLYLQKFKEKNYSELFTLHGKIYGPQRTPLDFPGRKKFKHVFFLRDPRDVLVSDYFSLVYTHPTPGNTDINDEFAVRRNRAELDGIDSYVLEAAEKWLIPLYNQYKYLRETSESHIFLKYDLFATNTPEFIRIISEYLELRPSEKDIELLTRDADPVQEREVLRHKRSGKSGQYLEKLQANTVEKLNLMLAEILVEWQFDI